MQIRNVSPYGALDVPLLRRVVDGGETVEVSDEQGAVLLEQHENYEPADDEAQAVRDAIDERIAAVDRANEQDAAPAKSAKKAEWVAWAIAQGADPDEAEAQTKEQLIDTYGSD